MSDASASPAASSGSVRYTYNVIVRMGDASVARQQHKDLPRLADTIPSMNLFAAQSSLLAYDSRTECGEGKVHRIGVVAAGPVRSDPHQHRRAITVRRAAVVVVLAIGFWCSPPATEAQPPAKVYRFGVLFAHGKPNVDSGSPRARSVLDAGKVELRVHESLPSGVGGALASVIAAVQACVVGLAIDPDPVCLVDAAAIPAGGARGKRARHLDPPMLRERITPPEAFRHIERGASTN